MANNDADRFRKQAQECVEQAERSIISLDKETWLVETTHNNHTWQPHKPRSPHCPALVLC